MAEVVIREFQAPCSDLKSIINEWIENQDILPCEAIPTDIEPVLLKQLGRGTGDIVAWAGDVVGRLEPFLGRILSIIKRRKLYESPEFGSHINYESWVRRGAKQTLGIGRDMTFKLVSTYELLPDLTREEISKLEGENRSGGKGKAYLVAQVLKSKISSGMPIEMVQDQRKTWIDIAHDHSVHELRKMLEEQKLLDKGQMVPPISVLIEMTADCLDLWKEITENPYVQERFGKTPGQIFYAALQEFHATVIPEQMDAARAKAIGQLQAS